MTTFERPIRIKNFFGINQKPIKNDMYHWWLFDLNCSEWWLFSLKFRNKIDHFSYHFSDFVSPQQLFSTL